MLFALTWEYLFDTVNIPDERPLVKNTIGAAIVRLRKRAAD